MAAKRRLQAIREEEEAARAATRSARSDEECADDEFEFNASGEYDARDNHKTCQEALSYSKRARIMLADDVITSE